MAEITMIGQIGGADVHAATLHGTDGLKVRLLTWGARLAELWVPDRNGVLADIVLGHDRMEDWQTHGRYVGATCGRYSNRIASRIWAPFIALLGWNQARSRANAWRRCGARVAPS